MGRAKTRFSQALTTTGIAILEETHYLSKEEDDERVKRLARKILAFAHSVQREKQPKDESKEAREVFGEESFFGL